MAGITVGLSNIHYALLLNDPIDGSNAVYTVPKFLKGAISAKINPNPNRGTLFADNGPMEVATTLGNIELELNVAELPLEDQAVILGHKLQNGVLTKKSSDTAPWVAIGFESLKSNGKRRFTWLVKGKFQEPEQSDETKNDNVNFQTPTISGSFVMRDADDVWQLHADEDAPGYIASVGANWFKSVYSGDNPAAVTVTIIPADKATAVVKTSSMTFTFSQPINPASVTPSAFSLVDKATTAAIATTLSIDTANKVVTMKPVEALKATTEYIAKVSKSVGLAADAATTFTTGS